MSFKAGGVCVYRSRVAGAAGVQSLAGYSMGCLSHRQFCAAGGRAPAANGILCVL
jgi:hypothetical protein